MNAHLDEADRKIPEDELPENVRGKAEKGRTIVEPLNHIKHAYKTRYG